MGFLVYFLVIDILIIYYLFLIDNDNDLVSVSQNELDWVICFWKVIKQFSDMNFYKELYNYIYFLVIGVVDCVSLFFIKLIMEIFFYYMKDESKVYQIS